MIDNAQGDLLSNLQQPDSQHRTLSPTNDSNSSIYPLNIPVLNDIVSTPPPSKEVPPVNHQINRQLDIFISTRDEKPSLNTVLPSIPASSIASSYSANRTFTSFSTQYGPGTEDDQPSLFDTHPTSNKPTTQTNSLSAKSHIDTQTGIDSQSIVDEVLQDFMPLIKAELKKRLVAAQIELLAESNTDNNQ